MKRESDFSGFHFSKSKSNVAFIVWSLDCLVHGSLYNCDEIDKRKNIASLWDTTCWHMRIVYLCEIIWSVRQDRFFKGVACFLLQPKNYKKIAVFTSYFRCIFHFFHTVLLPKMICCEFCTFVLYCVCSGFCRDNRCLQFCLMLNG